jgi:uncharacterized protein (DUF2235 family)
MAKNIVVCLDGTNNQLQAADNTNVVRLLDALKLDDPAEQVAYYDPGVGTFSASGAWTPPARFVSRYAGLMFGAGLRENLGEAYSFLSSMYETGDRIFVFGFSRGAYNARALVGMLDVFGLFRSGSENLIPYAVSAYTKQQRRGKDDPNFFAGLNVYAKTHARGRTGHAPVHFVGLWDTVKSAGTLTRQLQWPFTRQLPHAHTICHAVAIDENRRPFPPYLVHPPNPEHLRVDPDQDLREVWFAGVHSDVGGVFPTGTRLSDIPLKWMVDEANATGLQVRPHAYRTIAALEGVDPTGPWHTMSRAWQLLGPGRRTVPEGALIHASVKERVATHPEYANRLPDTFEYVCTDWREPRPHPPRRPAQPNVDCAKQP